MPRQSIAQAYFNRRMAALAGLGFASGFPALLTSKTLQAWLSGVDVKSVGLLSLVGFPYAFKFLWSPLMDRFIPPFLGRRRGWLLVTQALLVLAILAMALAGTRSLTLVAALALAVAFCSASQDIVADAYRTDILPTSELGAGASIFVTAYRVAVIAAGPGLLILAPRIGWNHAYMAGAGVMALSLIVTIFSPEPIAGSKAPATLEDAIVEPLAAFVRGRLGPALLIMAFVFIFKLPSELADSLMTKFLLGAKDQVAYASNAVGLGFTPEQVAYASQVVGLAAAIIGGLAGGVIVTRMGIRQSLWLFGVLQALSNAGFLLLAIKGRRMDILIAATAVESFTTGLVAAGFIAFLMGQCQRRYSATQYALLTGLMRLGGVLGGAPMGYLVAYAGYKAFFIFTILIAIPGMAMLPFLPGPRPDRDADSTTI